MDYFLDADLWYRTPRPLQVAVLVRAGLKILPAALELYIRTSIKDWAKINRDCREAEDSIAELFGVSAGGVRSAASEIRKRGVVRKGNNGQRNRPWNIADEKGKGGDPTKIQTSTPPQTKRLPHHKPNVHPTTNQTPHNKDIDEIDIEESNIEDKDRAHPSQGDSSIFKKEDLERALEYLNGFDLSDFNALCEAYYGLLKMFGKGCLHEMDLDRRIAEKCYWGVPQDFRRQAILAHWMAWFVLSYPKDEGDPPISKFRASWKAYEPTAIVLYEEITAAEREQRAEELRIQMERQQSDEDEREKVAAEREQEEAAARRAKRQGEEEEMRKLAVEREARLARERERFLDSLPSLGAVGEAVGAVQVPKEGIGKYGGYMDFLDVLLRSVPGLRLWRDDEPRWCNPVSNLLNEAKGDPDGLEKQTREFVVSVAEGHLGRLKREGHSALPKLEATSDMFVKYFGVDREYRVPFSLAPKAVEREPGLKDLFEDE